ncbi:lactococcin 972 family bacteriocin [Streptomyces xanthochromogenes]|uniref:lactococcin 972 family bacteriocin n=1 Tax=Streptomyces xanthochromogenes TaxID=67384 RepID=UPI003821D08D
MKIFARSIGFTVAGAALAAGMLATPATADSAQRDGSAVITVHHRGDGTQPPAELGNPTEWGVITFSVSDSAGRMKPMTVEHPGGGDWYYGSEARNDHKYCYSNYYHPSVMHGSTAKLGNASNKSVVIAGQYSNANVTGKLWEDCSAYYAKY